MRTHAELAEFLLSDLTAEICRVTLGGDAFLHNDQFVVKCETAGMDFAWHQDGAYVQHRIGDHPECVTCWCALDDVGEENGTIWVLPVSRFGRRELVEHIPNPQTNDRVGYFGDDPGEPISAPAGSVVVFSSLTFHRSGPNPTASPRRAYLAQYAPVPLLNAPGVFPQYYGQPFLKDGQRVGPN
jgi:ectoine hydroxylase-related dioxygenase (phytanoyl-CoA dioxygenase family)